MAWGKTKNVWSSDAADVLQEKNLQQTNMLASTWGLSTPASSKEDAVFQKILVEREREMLRRMGQSGWTAVGAFTFGAGAVGTFQLAVSKAFVDGLSITEAGSGMNSDVLSTITALAPPGSSSRTDLLYLEAFIVEVPGSTPSVPVSTNKPSASTIWKWGNVLYGGTNPVDDINEVNFEIRRRVQVQYRLRVISGINFVTYPNGLGDPNALAQGPNGSATALPFVSSPSDPGLWIAGNGSFTHQGILNTLDGVVYAIPMAKITRIAGQTVVNAVDVLDLRMVWASNLAGGVLQAAQAYINQHAVPTGGEISYPGLTTPNGFLPSLGGAYSRVTYPDLFAALTSTQSGTTTNVSPVITGLANTAALRVGLKIFSAAGIPANAVIQSIDSISQITMNLNATLTGSRSLLFHAHGAGDGVTTFNVPDRRDRGLVGAGTGQVVESVVSQTAAANAVAVASNTARWITGMPVTLSGVSGFVGLSNGAHWIVRASAGSVAFASSLANAQNGTVVIVTGTGSLTITCTFATRILGEDGGENAHAISLQELLAHGHPYERYSSISTADGGGINRWNDGTTAQTGSTGGNQAMNIQTPFGVTNWIIKT
ncbi:MAG: tail fiber protein [Nitrospirota bacterium]|nr:tail fiber protein [Nitrospirota bacterium]